LKLNYKKTSFIIIIILTFSLFFNILQTQSLQSQITQIQKNSYTGNPFSTELWEGQLQSENITGMHWYSYISGSLYNRTSWLVNQVSDVGTSFPSSPNTGQLYFRSDLGNLYVYNGTGWETGEGAQGSPGSSTLEGRQPYAYLVFNNATSNYAINGSTGQIQYSGSNIITVIQSCCNSLTAGRTNEEIVKVKGIFTGVANYFTVSSYTILDLREAKFILSSGCDLGNYYDAGGGGFIRGSDRTNGVSNIEIWGGVFDSNYPTNTASQDCIAFYAVSPAHNDRIKIVNSKFVGWAWGVALYSCMDSEVTGCHFSGYLSPAERTSNIIDRRSVGSWIHHNFFVNSQIDVSHDAESTYGTNETLIDANYFNCSLMTGGTGVIFVDMYSFRTTVSRNFMIVGVDQAAIGSNSAYALVIEGNTVYGKGGTANDCFNTANVKGFTAINNMIFGGTKNVINAEGATYDVDISHNYVDGNGYTCYSGIRVSQSSPTDIHAKACDNIIKNVGSAGIEWYNIVNGLIQNNIVYDNQAVATMDACIYFAANSSGTVIQGNHLQGKAPILIRIRYNLTEKVVISENTMEGTGTEIGIELGYTSAPDSITISNNLFRYLATGIWQKGTNVRIEQNHWDTVTTYVSLQTGGTQTFNIINVPFVDGTEISDSGWYINAASEYANAWVQIPDEAVAVMRIRVYARTVIAEVHNMHIEVVFNAGSFNASYNGHTYDWTNLNTAFSNFPADAIVYWSCTQAALTAVSGSHSMEIKVLYESAVTDDCATDAYFRGVTVEWI